MSLLLFFDPPQDGFQGAMDEVAVFATALSATRIRSHYQTGISQPGSYKGVVLADSPVGYWRFNEQVGACIDSSPSGYNGTYALPNGIVLRQSSILSASSSNRLVLYFREIDQAYLKNLDLDGGGWPMSRLDGLGHQPDFNFGIPTYPPRKQSDLDLLAQTSLDDTPQTDLEKLSTELINSEWIEVNLTWDSTSTTLKLVDTVGNGYTFTDLSLLANRDYILFADLRDNSLRVTIYQLDHDSTTPNAPTTGSIIWSPVVYDTTVAIDDTFIKRRQGRVGFFANLIDGDAYVYNVRPRRLTFAEWRSTPLNSITPVQGAQVYAGATPDREVFDGWFPGPNGGTISPDTQQSVSGQSFKISNDGTLPLQGIASSEHYLDNFHDTEINFDLNFPSAALSNGYGLEAFLYGENGRIVPLTLPTITPDRWQHVKLFINSLDNYQTGFYALCLIQTLNTIRSTWYIDNMSIKQRSIAWYGRGQINNAWKELDDGWIPFGDTPNDRNGGILFGNKNTQLQVKADALRQDVYMDNVKVVPQYAQPGRFVWTDQRQGRIPPPVANFVFTNASRVYTFNADLSTSQTYVASYKWDFGDGSRYGFGHAIQHTYAPGTYSVTLTITDSQGLRAQHSTTLVVT